MVVGNNMLKMNMKNCRIKIISKMKSIMCSSLTRGWGREGSGGCNLELHVAIYIIR